MAKKKAAQAGSSAKPATGRAPKKKTGKPQAADGPYSPTPADRPPVPEPEATQRRLLQVLARHGLVISYQQLALLSNPQILEAQKWVDVVEESQGETIPPLPRCLMDFATREVREKEGPAAQPGLPPRKYMACSVGGFGYKDGVIRLPVAVPVDRMDPEEAHAILNNKKVNLLLALQTEAAPGQKTLYSDAEVGRPTIDAVTSIKRYSCGGGVWKFTVVLATEDCDLELAGSFSGKDGRIEIQVLGEAESDHSNHRPMEGPHPDVEEGKDRPHGTPALAAAAKALKETEPTTELPAWANLPEVQRILAASLDLIGVKVDVAQEWESWSEDDRDEIESWAVYVAASAGGDETVKVPAIPKPIIQKLETQQFSHPVGYAKAHGTRSRLKWNCTACGEQWDTSRARKCPQCDVDTEPEDIVLIGFYGQPCVNIDGEFIGPDVAEYTILPTSDSLSGSVRVVQGIDKRWRAGLCAMVKGADAHGSDQINKQPAIDDAGRSTMHDAIAAAVGKLIDRWAKLEGDVAEQAVAGLKEYLGRIENGQDPIELDAELN